MITVPKLILEDAKIILEGAEMKAKEKGYTRICGDRRGRRSCLWYPCQ